MYTPFKTDLINNMDQMRISGTEPSSVILSQIKMYKKLESDAQKVLSLNYTKLMSKVIFLREVV